MSAQIMAVKYGNWVLEGGFNYSCPKCGAKVGERCRTPKGKFYPMKSQMFHSERPSKQKILNNFNKVYSKLNQFDQAMLKTYFIFESMSYDDLYHLVVQAHLDTFHYHTSVQMAVGLTFTFYKDQGISDRVSKILNSKFRA